MAESKTLPDHATCTTHRLYMLSCGDYEEQPDPPGTGRYLANAWHVRKLAERGLSPDPPEPPVGSIVLDHCGTYWSHSDLTGSWTPIGSQKLDRTWRQMLLKCGPLNMRVVRTRGDGTPLDFANTRQMPTRGALEKRLSDALNVLDSHDWCSGDREIAARIRNVLDGQGAPRRLPWNQWGRDAI